ncbi:MAG: DUF1727 domain-containing protein [Erysipelotrichaceae bacterium]
MQIRLAIVIAKVIKTILTIFKKRGGSLPGKIALKVCPNALSTITYPKRIVLVTGTNGKTTTTNMIDKVVREHYSKVISNVQGDNLIAGISTLILTNATMRLSINAEIMVIEVDEITVSRVMKEIPVTHFIVNNLFRDQLDRAGEMETIIQKLSDSLKEFTGELIINGDDPNVARLGYQKNRVSYFSVGKQTSSLSKSNEASEGRYCFVCNHELRYEYYQYSHIGAFHCPQCHFGENEKIQAVDIKEDFSEFYVENERYVSPYNTIYAIYNCMAVIALSKLLGISKDQINRVFEEFEMNDGRMESFFIERECLLNLIKNPTGANEVIKYIAMQKETKDIWLVLNDNGQDGRDVSWIYDVDFERLLGDDIANVVCSGTRAYDMALCIKYHHYEGNLVAFEDEDKALEYYKTLPNKGYILVTYTALQATRKRIMRAVK